MSSDLIGYKHNNINNLSFNADLNQISVNSRNTMFDEHDLVFREGEIPSGIYYLKSGLVRIYQKRESQAGRTTTKEHLVRLVTPGEYFGYKDLLKKTPYSYSAVAIESSEVVSISKESIEGDSPSAKQIMSAVTMQAVREVDEYEQQAKLQYLSSVRERIAHSLVGIADKFGRTTPLGIEINLKLSRKELAQLAGTINESLSRHLSHFKKQGMIDINARRILIRDRVGLLNIVNHQ